MEQRDIEAGFRALASDRRLTILEWLREPDKHFPVQVDGDLSKDGVCGSLIAQKMQVSQPTISEHLRVLTQAGFLKPKRIKQWTFYRRDEVKIKTLKRAMMACI
ncbi:MAG: helix-turn-helix domain-containing protein [Pseudomonadota bacterium]